MHPRYGRRLPLTDAQGRLVCLLAWSVPSASILIATVLNLFDEPRAIPFFVSEVDEKGLQDVVFTAGLSAAGLVQLFTRGTSTTRLMLNGPTSGLQPRWWV